MSDSIFSKPLVSRTPEQDQTLRQYAIEHNLPEDIYTNFTSFAKLMIPTWGEERLEWSWFHYYMCGGFQSVINGDNSFLTVELAPQHGKSVLLTLFAIYAMGINPNLQIIYATYSEDRATQVTKSYILKFMSSEIYKTIFPHILLKAELPQKGKNAKQLLQSKSASLKDNEFTISSPFGTNYLGRFTALGVGQGVHGRAANLFLIDDFCSNLAASKSEVFRSKLEGWYRTDVISRFQANTKFVIVCTRWYQMDPVGLLQIDMNDILMDLGEDKAPKAKFIKVRVDYRTSDNNPPEDPRTQDGEILWTPFTVKYYLARKSVDFNALYNCDPTDVESLNQLKESDFGYYDELPNSNGRYVFSIDAAATANKGSDRTAIGYWFVVGRKRYLIKLWSLKVEVPELIKITRELLNNYEYDDCLVEHASAGIPLCQQLKSEGYKVIALGFNGQEINSTNKIQNSDKIGKSNSKIDRYYRVIPEFVEREHLILIPREPIEHQQEFIRQLTTFDGTDGRADDFVDMATQIIYYTKQNMVRIVKDIFHNYQNKVATKPFMCYNTQNSRIMQYSRGR